MARALNVQTWLGSSTRDASDFALRWLTHLSLRCLLTGHDHMIRRAPARMYLECVECGYETRGWMLETRMRVRPPRAAPAAPLVATQARLMKNATTSLATAA